MSEKLSRRSLKSSFILACMLGIGSELSACTQVDEMFDQGIDVAAPTRSQMIHASPRDQVRAASLRCDSIADERTWLDCYYGAAQSVRADLGLPPAPASQQKLVPPPA